MSKNSRPPVPPQVSYNQVSGSLDRLRDSQRSLEHTLADYKSARKQELAKEKQRLVKQFKLSEQIAEEMAALGRPALRDDVQKYRRRLIKAGIIDDAGVDEKKKRRGGRPQVLSAEQVREMQVRAKELWPRFKHLKGKGAQGRVVELIQSEWKKRRVEISFSTVVRYVMAPLGF
jgi:hypothetical protein